MTSPDTLTPQRVQRVYVTLIMLQTLAASLIWGVNTLFLLDAGLSITEAFVANAAFTAGMVVFEVPTGVVADAAGRRASFILGAATLLVATLAYLGLWYVEADLIWWILSSAFIGLGFTFFSGATEAWLVDALDATGFRGAIEDVFGKGQTATGAATLLGTIGGGFLAQISLGAPYLARSLMLGAVIVAAFLWMHDIGYKPVRGDSIRAGVANIVKASLRHGWGNRPVRLFMLAAPFSTGIGIWAFYAFQPYLLELFGDPDAVYLSGIAAGIFAMAQIVGGRTVIWARRSFTSRTSVVLTQIVLSSLALVVVGASSLLDVPWGFWLATALLTLIALTWAVSGPMQQAFINACIPSQQRATVLSFSSLMGSAGGVVAQPALGRVADVYSLGLGYAVAGVAYALQIPFIWRARRLGLAADNLATIVDAARGDDLAS